MSALDRALAANLLARLPEETQSLLLGASIGIIRQVGLVEAAQENAITDLEQMVGGSTEERARSRPLVGVRSRLPWLNINFLGLATLIASMLAASELAILLRR